jgi:PAS domain S-box-containing protein
MKKHNNRSWLFPCCLFVFFSIFITVKFVFIFFFRASYEPEFIFELTPFHILSGINNIQLLFLSLAVILLDTYFHVKATKRSLIYSYLPTSLMLSGLGLTIMFGEMDMSYVYHYLIFGCLLLVVLIDQRHILMLIETPTIIPEKESDWTKIKDKKTVDAKLKPTRAEASRYYKSPQPYIAADKTFELKELSENFLKKMQVMLEELERKTIKLERLEKESEEKRINILEYEILFTDRLISYFESKERFDFGNKDITKETSSADQIFIGDKIKDNLIIDEITDCAAVVQRGILKQINKSFADFLGYEINEIVDKSFFVFVAPDNLDDVKKYYLNKLKGVASKSYETVFLTKDNNELFVEITAKPTIYKGEVAEILVVKEVKNK